MLIKLTQHEFRDCIRIGVGRHNANVQKKTKNLRFSDKSDVDIAILKQQRGVKTASQENGKITVGVDSLSASASVVLAWLASNGHRVNHISSGRANLETLFLALTGRQLRD